ncbi:MAG: hypothetical protein ACOYN6_06675 [Ignavibacteria bacterium]
MKIIKFILIITILIYCQAYGQSEHNSSDKEKDSVTKSQKESLKKVSDSLKSISTEKTYITNIFEKLNPAFIDSLRVLKAEIVEQKSKQESIYAKQTILIYISLGFSLVALLIIIATAINSKNKFISVWNNINKNKNQNNYGDDKLKVQSLENKINTLAKESNELLNLNKSKFDLIYSELKDLQMKINATSSFSDNVNTQTIFKEQEVSRIIKDTKPESKNEYFIVEYFVESGIVKFRETNHGTPFYIQKNNDVSVLIINEEISASSNYSESIKRCFEVSGQMTGKYRNRIPAKCTYEANTFVWRLDEKGTLESA